MLFWYFWCFTLFLYSQPVWGWLSLLYNISSRNIKKKNTSKYQFIRSCTVLYSVLQTERWKWEMREMQRKKTKKLKADKHVSVSWLWACGYWWWMSDHKRFRVSNKFCCELANMHFKLALQWCRGVSALYQESSLRLSLI